MPYNTRSSNTFDILNIEVKKKNSMANTFDKLLNYSKDKKKIELKNEKKITRQYTLFEKKYFNKLDSNEKQKIIKVEHQLQKLNSNVPPRFKTIALNLPDNIKSIILSKIEQMNQLDADAEYYKISKWINTFFEIPFDNYSDIYRNIDKTNFVNIKSIINTTRTTMDELIYGHDEAKGEILEYICNSISNKNINGKILALQGPPGNGKTTLIKSAVSKALNKYFGFIPLGGSHDSSFLEGFDYTYEGSRCGRICDILRIGKIMDPIIYFDELDKISDSSKGEEIAHLLCHLTDGSQNSTFYDRYFSEIPIDLSKVTFIFSFNNEDAINPILKDRLNIIRTKGYTTKDKIKICNKHLLKEIFNNMGISDEMIVFKNDVIEYIIQNYTDKEEGVRELKRILEKICSKINLYNINNCNDAKDIVDFKIKNFKIPFEVTTEVCHMLVKKKENNESFEHLYI